MVMACPVLPGGPLVLRGALSARTKKDAARSAAIASAGPTDEDDGQIEAREGPRGQERTGVVDPARSRERATLVRVSLAQLACGLAGMALAIRRGHAYDVGFMRGGSERVGRDALLSGTALSAPVTMMAAQAVLTAVVAARESARAASGLRSLGALMVAGYLAERLVRHRLWRPGWERLETPVAALGLGLSVAMVLLAGRARAQGRS
jgi:hypothetical protein